MALLSFPASTTNGELYPTTPTTGQNQYQWEAATSTWRLLGVSTGVSTGTYGNATNVGQFTVDAQGRLTSAVNIPLTVEGVSPPLSSTATGADGQISADSSYFYWYSGTTWQRVAADTTPW